ncbi:hypothetical protein PFICI_02316 [Pestalotiopsis fici W106-1]|uniref:O-methyltransferase C-terminal domain-containing protein n=1 Tax=Pestalotiopsis fici (strain W106-1 / CGMCC3.15140) TaxID=1229662 RepID=W3XGH0_PESFW|nr:uncharacterized protein PFICI_02316 [Pestalotiopsis fici W106-1]ETS84291.1 hypothetical protein PFICI_02316 [Pestalotiopsis fici W106-1]
MSPTRSLSELAQLIQIRTVSIEGGLKSAGIPQPSFDAAAPAVLPIGSELEDIRDDLIEALDELRALVLGPVGHLFSSMLPVPAINATLHGIYRFRIAQHLGPNETISHSQLAERCGLPEADLRRYLRMATSLRLFDEPEKGMVRHNAPSAFLAATPPAHDMLGMLLQEQASAGLVLADTLQRYPGSEEPGDAAGVAALLGTFAPKQGDDEGAAAVRTDYYSAISGDPERVSMVASAMSLASKIPSHDVRHFVEGCGWDKSPESCPRKVVDIGGSEGRLCMALLQRFDGIQEAISLDRPEVVEGTEVPEALRGRLSFGAYDFFEEQAVKDADVYIFRNIFHNWSDKYAVRMLRNQIPALKPGARLFVNEACLPEPDASRLVKNQIAWGSDLIMKMIFNAQDRSKEDWYGLFAKADARFKVVSINTPPRSALAVIEVIWEG